MLAQGAAHPNPNPKHNPNPNPNPNPTPNPTSTPNQAPLTVLADTLVVEWSHRPTSLHMQEHFGYARLGLGLALKIPSPIPSPTLALTQEHFGYAFTVVASRKGGAVRERPPPLQQLQRSLLYLGAKYAGVLVYGEPVADEEKAQWHGAEPYP